MFGRLPVGDDPVKHWLHARWLAVAIALTAAPLVLAQDHGDSHAQPEAAGHGAPAAEAPHAAPDAHGDGGGHAASEPDPFAGGIGNAVLTLLIFGAVVLILGKKAWPPLMQTLEQREHAIRGALEEARREREEAEKLLAKYQEQIDHARQEATAIVEEGRRDADVVRRRIQDEARAEAAEMIERAKREIQLATDAAIKELYDRTADLAVEVAGAIIRKELKADDHQALVRESLARMQDQAGRLN
ncbi:MAG: ATP synthase F0 subunit B [Planctomycetota bacterium]|nr:MAG: ATP synthase F0 subunit B [Planctomycetota bacterium]